MPLSPPHGPPGGVDDAYGKAAVRPADGAHAADGVRALRGSVRWPSQSEELQLHGPVPVHGIRAADIPGESARHRGLSALAGREALSHGDPRPSRAQHARERQRNARLADLCRLRPAPDRYRSQALFGRAVRVGLTNTAYALDSTTIDLSL